MATGMELASTWNALLDKKCLDIGCRASEWTLQVRQGAE